MKKSYHPLNCMLLVLALRLSQRRFLFPVETVLRK